ncbi:MAG: FAD-dependent oxidoreductase [Oceanipulchritudo sp.]
MIHKEETCDVVVCGGGMAGFCAAVAAARHGAKTILVQDRPVLGGNASSEVRVTVHGAACHHYGMRETGIIGEAMNAERHANHLYPIENGWTNSVHDMALYDIAVREPNLTLQLNTALRDVQLSDGSWGLDHLGQWPAATDEKGYLHRPACHKGTTISAVKAVVANAETELLIHAKQFIDCTGDALLAHLAGCEWRMGSESREETGEIHAPEKASRDTMGNSIHIRCIDTGRPAPFTPPDWAIRYEDADFFYKQGRRPNEPEGGFWWIEIGVPWDTIHDNEIIRHELTRHALGVWDWMKNRDPEMMDTCRNYALEFIGQVPGKRESRRVMGLHFLNENELQRREKFPDECAYGGWFIDLHTPGGLLAPTSEPDSALGYDSSLREVALKLIGPYGIPLRSLVSKDVDNLAMAGRNISVTHAALGTIRVMATCGLMGQAIGTAAARAAGKNQNLSAIAEKEAPALQQALLRDGCYLPNSSNTDPSDLARKAQAKAGTDWRFSGLGVWDEVEDKNLRQEVWARGRGNSMDLAKTPCQWLQLGGGRLDRIGVALKSESAEAEHVSLLLRKVSSLWDYATGGEDPVWQGTSEIPASFDDMAWVETSLVDLVPGCYRLELRGSANLSWRISANRAHGVAGGHIIGSGRFHGNRTHGDFAFQVEPAQAVFDPSQVLSGITRPADGTNIWLSDPAACLPQWIELQWESSVDIRTVELTFPGQLVLETHWENPFYVPPHVARQYRLQVPEGNGWRTLHHEWDNAQARRRHGFSEPIRTGRLRLLIEATHGARSAGLTEIRCYG